MQINIKAIETTTPKKCNRTKRLRKKLHVGEFAETLFQLNIKCNFNADGNVPDELVDAVCDLHPDTMQTMGVSVGKCDILYVVKTSEYSTALVQQVTDEVFAKFNEIDPAFTTVQEVEVETYDAWWIY